MQEKPFIEEMELIQSDLTSGLAAFDLVYQTLSEKKPLDQYTEALFVIYTYLQGVHKDLARLIQAGYQKEMA